MEIVRSYVKAFDERGVCYYQRLRISKDTYHHLNKSIKEYNLSNSPLRNLTNTKIVFLNSDQIFFIRKFFNVKIDYKTSYLYID